MSDNSVRRRRIPAWAWIAVAIIGLGILAVIALAGAGLYFFSRHVQTATVTMGEADARFVEVQKRLEGQTPLIELDEQGHFLRSNPREASAGAAAPSALHVMAYDADDGQIVTLSIPFWLLRLQKGNTTIDLGGRRTDLEDLKLTVEDLEGYGPALIVDHRDTDGARVLVWSQ